MRKYAYILPLLLLTAAATVPASAQDTSSLEPVEASQLDHYIGSTVFGEAFTPLGVVASADTNTGLIAIVGPDGELATISSSLLYTDGMDLRAPALSIGDIANASNSGESDVPFVAGTVSVYEPPSR
jgi:hypothetical protein